MSLICGVIFLLCDDGCLFVFRLWLVVVVCLSISLVCCACAVLLCSCFVLFLVCVFCLSYVLLLLLCVRFCFFCYGLSVFPVCDCIV